MKIINKFLIATVCSFAIILSSCSDDKDSDPVIPNLNAPASYAWTDANGSNTVSFGGQTTRLHQAAVICSRMGNSAATFAEIDEMFNLGEGFYDPSLNFSNSGKKVANKTGAYSANSDDIRAMFDSWIVEFTTEVVPAMVAGTPASAGVAGVLPDGTYTRELNSKGMELDQLFTKGLIGALCGDQIINGYLSDVKIGDDVDNVRSNEGGHTTMEHHWDEGYGYLYGLQSDQSVYDLDQTNGDVLLYKYYVKDDFAAEQVAIYDAFKMGREAITMDAGNETPLYSDVKMAQADIVKTNISRIIVQKAYDYLHGAAEHLNAGNARDGDFFHGLSEGVGFVVSLQFTNSNFSHADVNAMMETLSSGDGLWDVTATELEQMASQIQAAL